MEAALQSVVKWMEALLDPGGVTDAPGAMNGLQVANAGRVRRIAAAVDACEWTIREAARVEADLLLVHHGLFWGGLAPLTGANLRKVRALLDGDIAVFSMHLPLDRHPRIGNNALLCKALGLGKLAPFFRHEGVSLGFQASVRISRGAFVERLAMAVGGPVHVCPGGPGTIRRVGVVSGGAGGDVARAAAEGVDTFVTGEAPHWAYPLAEELGVNLLLAGHYATETFGVRALAEAAGRKFKLPHVFIDHPTGL